MDTSILASHSVEVGSSPTPSDNCLSRPPWSSNQYHQHIHLLARPLFVYSLLSLTHTLPSLTRSIHASSLQSSVTPVWMDACILVEARHAHHPCHSALRYAILYRYRVLYSTLASCTGHLHAKPARLVQLPNHAEMLSLSVVAQ